MKRLAILPLLATLLAGGGCGYSTRRLNAFPEARTVAVTPFTNQSYRRDLGVRLTRAVVDELRTRTSYAIGAPDTADLVVQGEFTADETVQGLDLDRVPIIQRLSGTLAVRIVERATGKVVAKNTFFVQSEFRPSDAGETLDARGSDEWTRRMAVQVVQLFDEPL